MTLTALLYAVVLSLAWSCPKKIAERFAPLPRSIKSVEQADLFRSAPISKVMEWSHRTGRPVTIVSEDGGIYSVQALEAPVVDTVNGERVKVQFFPKERGVSFLELDDLKGHSTYGVAMPEFARIPPGRAVVLELSDGTNQSGSILGYSARGEVHWLPEGSTKPLWISRKRLDVGKTVAVFSTHRPLERGPFVAYGRDASAEVAVARGRVSVSTEKAGRVDNQDAALVVEKDDAVFLAVVDGIGGYTGGQAAARIVTEAFKSATQPRASIYRPFTEAHRALKAASQRGELEPRSGVTALLCEISGDQLETAHLGDVRAVVVSGDKIKMQTTDHSAAQAFTARGRSAEAEQHQSAIYESLNGEGRRQPELNTTTLQRGDWVVIASDGLWRHVRSTDLPEILSQAANPTEARALLRAACRDATDNVTILVLRHGDP